MKRFILSLLCVVAMAGLGMAQNANRSGFFLEAGIGGMVGNTPRTSISISNNVMQYKCASGAAVDFGFGARFRFARHWAYELKAEANTTLNDPANTLVGRFLPVGFRYTTGELWRNYSLYLHFNVGGAVSVLSGKIDYDNLDTDMLYPNMSDTKIKGYESAPGFGPAYSLGIGANITTHFYAEACWNGEALMDCYGKKGKGTVNGGMVALIIGYRF